MVTYKFHMIVLGTKIFDKGMMTYQQNYGQEYVIPIYAWYLEGGDQTILVDTGEMSPIQSPAAGAVLGFEREDLGGERQFASPGHGVARVDR